MNVLPAIDTIYPSLAAFKLDILKRGEQYGVTYVSKMAKSSLLWLQCNVAVGTSFCGHSVQAKKIRDGGGVKVVTTRGDHTCSQSQLEASFRNPVMLKNREVRLEEAREKVTRSVKEVQEHVSKDVEMAISGDRPSVQLAAQKLYRKEGSSSEEDPLSEEEEEEEDGEEHNPHFDYHPEDDEMEEGKIGKTRQLLSAEVLRIRAALLLETGSTIQLPQHSQGFQDPNELLVLWHAFARQEGFLLVRTSKGLSQTNLRAECTWKRSEDWHKRCFFHVQAKRYSDGLWHSISSTTLVHNHSSKDQASATSSSGTPSISSHTSAFSHHPFIVQAQSLSSNARPLSIPQVPLAQLPVMPSSSQSHPSDLINFLRSFQYSPSTIFETLSILRVAGVNSLEVLVSLLSMGETTFSRFVNSIGGEIGNRLKSVAKKIREELV